MARFPVLVLLTLVVAGAPEARAATITVTTTADSADPCTGGSCSLRGAVRTANETAGADRIELPASTAPYELTLPGVDDTNEGGDVDVLETLTIAGAGQAQTVIVGTGEDRVIDGRGGPALVLQSLTLKGGGVRNSGPLLELTDVTVTGLTQGEAIEAESPDNTDGDLLMTRTRVVGNTSDDELIEHGPDQGGTFRVVDCEVSDNTTDEDVINVNPAGGTAKTIFERLTFARNTFDDDGIDFTPRGTVRQTSFEMTGSKLVDNRTTPSGELLLDIDPASFLDLVAVVRIADSVFSGNALAEGPTLDINPSTFERLDVDARIERSRFEKNVTGSDTDDGGPPVLEYDPTNANGGVQSLVFADSLAVGNEARRDADEGIVRLSASDGTATITGSTFAANKVGTTGDDAHGGTLLQSFDMKTTVVNSTFDGNVQRGGDGSSSGAAITTTGGAIVVTHSTITGNAVTQGDKAPSDNAPPRAGGLFSSGEGTITVTGSIVHGNTAFGEPADCSGAVTSGGSNLETGKTCGFASARDRQGIADAGLRALADNGGLTLTRALAATSPAKDAAAADTCPPADQRGVKRPQEGGCDIGAFEHAPPPPPPPPAPRPAPPSEPPSGPPSAPPTGQGTAPAATAPPVAAPPRPSLLLSCSRTALVLVDVVRRRGKVLVTGQAAPTTAGQSVRLLVADKRGARRTAALAGTTVVAVDGTFTATVPAPPRRLAVPEYVAESASGQRSQRLELDRRMYADEVAVQDGRITLAGHVTRPLPRPGQLVTVRIQTDCAGGAVAGTTKLDRRGRFRLTFPVPAGVPELLVRADTRVPVRRGGRARFRTFTLPVPVRP